MSSDFVCICGHESLNDCTCNPTEKPNDILSKKFNFKKKKFVINHYDNSFSDRYISPLEGRYTVFCRK
jgi:hypothetical protein